jgi:ABC-type transport system involved in cytochrome c biogenesis permease subunit
MVQKGLVVVDVICGLIQLLLIIGLIGTAATLEKTQFIGIGIGIILLFINLLWGLIWAVIHFGVKKRARVPIY